MLAYNTTNFLAIQPIRCSDTENLLHQFTLQFMAAVANDFRAVVATCVLASIMRSKRLWWDSVHTYMQLSCVYLLSTVDILHVIKCTRWGWE